MVIDAKTIVIHLLYKMGRPYLAVKRFQNLLLSIPGELAKRNMFENYDIEYDVSVSSIEQMVLRNNQIFDMDSEKDLIYLRNRDIEQLAMQYTIDSVIGDIIDEFIAENNKNSKTVMQFTAEQARSRHLIQKKYPEDELGKVLWEIERVCYLQEGLYWESYLQTETVDALIALGYKVVDKSIGGVSAYTIDWIY